MSFRFVFEIAVRPGEDESFIEHWHEGSRAIQEYPGAQGTRLHKKCGEAHSFVAIAEWESWQARQAAMEDIERGESERAQRVKVWGQNEDYGAVAVLGELNEIDASMPADARN